MDMNNRFGTGHQNPDGQPVAGPASPPPANHAPSPVQPRMRERCMYGANCYRRNPIHKQEFSHPSDADWGSGPLGVCPYGGGCVRRNPAHWQQNTHPPGTVPPGDRQGKKQRRMKKRISTDNEETDCDTPPDSPDVIVTGKRARKKIDVQKWSDSESNDEDPFQTDDEDEWQPSGNVDTEVDSQFNSQEY